MGLGTVPRRRSAVVLGWAQTGLALPTAGVSGGIVARNLQASPAASGADRGGRAVAAAPGLTRGPAGRAGRSPRPRGVDTVHHVGVELGRQLVATDDLLMRVRALGIDQRNFLRGSLRGATVWVTGFVDLDRGRLLDVAESTAVAFSVDLGSGGRLAPSRAVAAMDHPQGRPRNRNSLQDARIADWHMIRLANQALEQDPRPVQQQMLGHRGRKGESRSSVLARTGARSRSRRAPRILSHLHEEDLAPSVADLDRAGGGARLIHIHAASSALCQAHRACDGVGAVGPDVVVEPLPPSGERFVGDVGRRSVEFVPQTDAESSPRCPIFVRYLAAPPLSYQTGPTR